MNVLSLFDGMSCGQIALDRLGVPYGDYLASEIDKWAIMVTKDNFIDTEHIGDVSKINTKDLPKIDLLIGGSPCFVKGTKIITKNGYKNIEEISVGDYVLTHKRRFRKVVDFGCSKNKKIWKIKAQGIMDTYTTEGHPYYIKTSKRVWDNSKRSSVRVFSKAKWKKVSEISKGDFLGLPILPSLSSADFTDEDLWLIGRYIADGHVRKDYRKSENRPNDRHWQMIISVGKDKAESFKAKVKNRHFGFYKHTKSCFRAVFSSKKLVQFVENYCGTNSGTKIIPMNLLLLDKKKLEILLDGYMSGDGCFTNNKFKASSINKEMIMSINLAVAKCYGTGSTFNHTIRPKKTIIEGRVVNQQDTYSCSFDKKINKQDKFHVSDGFIWLPIKDVFDTDSYEDVYNMTVEEDNTYFANNSCVHNCTNLSFAGKQKGMSTKCKMEILTLDHYLELKEKGFEFEGQSYLFWEFIRILRDTNPKYFLLENVPMSKKWEKTITDAIKEVRPDTKIYKFNSALVSAQNRNRIYWTNTKNVPDPIDREIIFKDMVAWSRSTRYPENEDKYVEQRYRIDGKANTLTTGQGCGSFSSCNYIPNIEEMNHTAKALEYMNRKVKGGRTHWDFGFVNVITADKAHCMTANFHKGVPYNVLVDEICPDPKIFRKLHPIECENLQTVPRNYTLVLGDNGKQLVSNTQRYKMLGNGWTVEMIMHIMKYMDL